MKERTELGNKYALAALKEKRATLAGEIESLQGQIEWRRKALANVDACLALFDPEIDPNALPLKRPRKRVKLYRQGELGRIILDALRKAGKPVSVDAVVTAIIRAQGLPEAAGAALKPRINSNLNYLVRTGKVVKTGKSKGVTWGLRQESHT